MHKLTADGQRIVNDIAMRYGLSSQAVEMMLDAVANGGGRMAQFNISELGGGGQWMQGGMTMVGDMFNHGLKMTVDNLCAELSTLYFNQPFAPQPQAHQGSQHGNVSLFVPGSGQSNWWPQDLGQPSSSGSQNNMRYAYFPHVSRLAIDAGGTVAVYDTLNHQIGGFSQQQSYDGSITLSSQFGMVQLSSLPRVDLQNPLASAPPVPQPPTTHQAPQPVSQPVADFTPPPVAAPAPQTQVTATLEKSAPSMSDIFELIEKLGALRDKGFVTEEEFNAKKSELLSRL
jgi:hypothetical protein